MKKDVILHRIHQSHSPLTMIEGTSLPSSNPGHTNVARRVFVDFCFTFPWYTTHRLMFLFRTRIFKHIRVFTIACDCFQLVKAHCLSYSHFVRWMKNMKTIQKNSIFKNNEQTYRKMNTDCKNSIIDWA